MPSSLPESLLNPLLRRADWRFLLPDPEPAVSICFAEGLVAQAVKTFSGRVATAHDVSPGACDLAVAVDPDDKTLRAAWTTLRPGGACYIEWYSPLNTRIETVQAKLSAMGFKEVVCYWAWPAPARSPALFRVPLDASGALEYFMTHRTPSTSKLRDGLRSLLRLLWRAALALGFTIPICSIARKPNSPDASAVDESSMAVLDWIRANWQRWDTGPSPDRLSWLLLTGGEHSNNKVVGLVFAEPQNQPCIAVKMPRVPASLPGLMKEKETLDRIHSSLAGIKGVPRVLFCEQRDSFVMLGETALTGVPLYTKLNLSNYKEFALQVADWQITLAGQAKPVPVEAWRGRLVDPVVEEFSRAFDGVVESHRFTQARDTLATLEALPLVVEQRDFSPWNINVNANGQLVVLDWESAELSGLPGVDLIYFCANAGFFLDGAWRSGRFRESYRMGLDRATFTGSVQSETLARYAARIGISTDAFPPLRVLTWMVHARSDHQRLVAAGTAPTRAWLQSNLFLNLWEEELQNIEETRLNARL